MRVVVVDDQEVARDAVRELLEASGHTVVGEAADGAGARDAVRRLRPDLVLVDLRLGSESGFDVARSLTTQWADLPVVLMSMSDHVPPGPVQASGARAFVMKERLPTVDLRVFLEGDDSSVEAHAYTRRRKRNRA